MPKKAKTYEQEIAETRLAMREEGTHGSAEVHWAMAEILLDDASFKKLAKARFPGRDDAMLVECVACSL